MRGLPTGDRALSQGVTDYFQQRHIGTTAAQQQEMASTIGFESVDHLIDTAIPDNIKLGKASLYQPHSAKPKHSKNYARTQSKIRFSEAV